MLIALLTLLACGSTTPPDCETLDEATCQATDGCFAIRTQRIDCQTFDSQQAYVGCMGPRHDGEDSALQCEDIAFYCQTDGMGDDIWDFRDYCIPDSVVCTGSSMSSSVAQACAEINGE